MSAADPFFDPETMYRSPGVSRAITVRQASPLRVAPTVDLAALCGALCLDREVAAVWVLEALASGLMGRDVATLTEAEVCALIDRACARLDKLGW